MASRRISAEEARRRILDLASDDSGDESGRETDLEEEPHIPDSDDSCSDDDQPEQPEVLRIGGRDGTIWRHVRDANLGRRPGRVEQHNVFSERVGVTRQCGIIETPIDAFRLIFDEWCLRHIVSCTIDYARNTGNEDWSLDVEDLEKFIGLLYLLSLIHI